MNETARALKYAIAVFVLIMFAWWFQGGHIISFLAPDPAPSEVLVLGTANAFRWVGANVFGLFQCLLK